MRVLHLIAIALLLGAAVAVAQTPHTMAVPVVVLVDMFSIVVCQ